MTKLYSLKVAPNHRYESLPVRTKHGKVRVTKGQTSVVASDDLAPGEEFTIRRYAEEGRFIVEELDDTPWEDVDATDEAWALAYDEDVDLTQVVGTGKEGRVLVADVKAML